MSYPSPDRVPSVLTEPSLFYDPPYERPVEDEFAWHLVKYLDPAVALAYQVRLATPCAPLWVDFVVEQGARRIAFEIDDLTVPDAPPSTVERRDALLLGSGAVDVLYRFRAEDVLGRLHDALLTAARLDPALFSERGRINLHTLASPAARALNPQRADARVRLVYPGGVDDIGNEDSFAWPEPPSGDLVVRRLSAARPAVWLADYEAALGEFGLRPEEVDRGWARSA